MANENDVQQTPSVSANEAEAAKLAMLEEQLDAQYDPARDTIPEAKNTVSEAEQKVEDEIAPQLSAAYENLTPVGNKYEDGPYGMKYASWKSDLQNDSVYQMLEWRVAKDGPEAQQALDGAVSLAYSQGLHPAEVMAAASGMDVGDYCEKVLGGYNVAEGMAAGKIDAMNGLASYHEMDVEQYTKTGDAMIDTRMDSLAESAAGVGHNNRSNAQKAVASEREEMFGNTLHGNTSEWAWDSSKSDMANEARREYSDIEVADRAMYGDSYDGVTSGNSDSLGMTPSEQWDATSLQERYAQYDDVHVPGVGPMGGMRHPVDETVDNYIKGDDYASKLLRDGMKNDAASLEDGIFGSAEQAVARGAYAVSQGAEKNGLHPLEQAALDQGLNPSEYMALLVEKQGLTGDDAECAYAAGMKSLADYHNVSPQEYAAHGFDQAYAMYTGAAGTELNDWSDEIGTGSKDKPGVTVKFGDSAENTSNGSGQGEPEAQRNPGNEWGQFILAEQTKIGLALGIPGAAVAGAVSDLASRLVDYDNAADMLSTAFGGDKRDEDKTIGEQMDSTSPEGMGNDKGKTMVDEPTVQA